MTAPSSRRRTRMVTSRRSTGVERGTPAAGALGVLLAFGGKCTHRQIERPVVRCREHNIDGHGRASVAALRAAEAEWSRGRSERRGPIETEWPGCWGVVSCHPHLRGRLLSKGARAAPSHRAQRRFGPTGEQDRDMWVCRHREPLSMTPASAHA
jgi:hypothetical protein